MNKAKNAITILMAEDDPDDRLIIRDAFEEARIGNTIHYVEDGEELMDYLYSRGNTPGQTICCGQVLFSSI